MGDRVRGLGAVQDDKQKDSTTPKPLAEEGTLAALWQEGEEELDTDWLDGGGLKFTGSAEKFKATTEKERKNKEIFDPLAVQASSEFLEKERRKRNQTMERAPKANDPSKLLNLSEDRYGGPVDKRKH